MPRRARTGTPRAMWRDFAPLALLTRSSTDRDRRETFRAYVEQFLAPSLAPGDIVVVHNLIAHKIAAIAQAIAAAGQACRNFRPTVLIWTQSSNRPPTKRTSEKSGGDH